MKITIYGDVLAAVNFIVTLAILRLCGKILGVLPGKISRYVSAGMGAAAAFIIFIPMHSMILQLLYRLLVSVFLVGIAFPLPPGKAFFRAVGIFYAVSFLMAGAVAGLLWIFPSAGFYTCNGVVYFNIRPLALLGGVTIAYIVVTLFDRFNARRVPPQEVFTLLISRSGRTVPVKALADSGNRLTEPFSGLPVVVVTAGSVWELLSDEERRVVSNLDMSCALPGIRWVLCRSVANAGLLPAFLPDSLTVHTKGKEAPLGAYFAISGESIGEDGIYSAVFNPKMIQVLM